MFDNIYGRKQFAKDKCPIPHDIMTQFCKETEKQYREVDCNGLLSHMCNQVDDFELPLEYRLKTQQEIYGYISYIDLSRPNTGVVMDLNTKYSTFKAQLYQLSTGETITVKVKKKSYEQLPIAVGMVINYRTEKKPAWKKDGENWVQDYSREDIWLTSYTIE